MGSIISLLPLPLILLAAAMLAGAQPSHTTTGSLFASAISFQQSRE
jgi:hypothetical protein